MKRRTVIINFVIPIFIVASLAFAWMYTINDTANMELIEAKTVVNNLTKIPINEIDCNEALLNIAKLESETFIGAELIREKWIQISDYKGCDTLIFDGINKNE